MSESNTSIHPNSLPSSVTQTRSQQLCVCWLPARICWGREGTGCWVMLMLETFQHPGYLGLRVPLDLSFLLERSLSICIEVH